MTRAAELIEAGTIGEVVHLTGFGPHRLNRPLRPPWFFERSRTGGILCDLASHQIDQFLYLTGARDAEVAASTVANRANPADPELEDYGEVLLRTARATGFFRVDWYTPAGLATWGRRAPRRARDRGVPRGPEVRRHRGSARHRPPVSRGRARHAADRLRRDAPLPYYEALVRDVRERTETAMSQRHCFKVMELALRAQVQARRLP